MVYYKYKKKCILAVVCYFLLGLCANLLFIINQD